MTCPSIRRPQAVVGWAAMAALLCIPPCAMHAAQQFVPSGRINPENYTVFMAVDARLSAGLSPWHAGGHGKFPVVGWKRSSQYAEWPVRAEAADDYEASVLLRVKSRRPLRIEVSGSSGKVIADVPANACRSWDRVKLAGLLAMPAGDGRLDLRIIPADDSADFDVEVHAIELVRPSVRTALAARAQAMRADPAWFQNARYGLMVHWTKQSMPLKGEPKSYDEAVAAFDVEAFADQASRTGAGFVVLTTSHAMHYFPAPLESLDRILPGRTSRRNLVSDLAAALARRGMKLMLYYHLGASSDPDWIKASGAFDTNTEKFFGNWRAIISEAGDHYGDQLAGWWFDDGSTNYYYRSPPWESLARAAKAGNPRRLISFNAWELANPTQFHDFCTGEGCQDPRGLGGLLAPGGNGRYPSGTHAGLQASACLITERDWGHFHRDTPLPTPKWNVEQLTKLINGFIACRNVPIFNLEITQDGKLSPASIELFEQAAKRLNRKAKE
jgi:hypothetical protein